MRVPRKVLYPNTADKVKGFLESGNLRSAYGAIDGIDSFEAWSLRGWIRSIGMRLDEAAQCIEEASKRIAHEPYSERGWRGVLRHVAIAREHAILVGKPATFDFPLGIRGEVGRVHAVLDAWEALNRGDDAEPLFRAVLDGKGSEAQKGFGFLGLAMALQAQGRHEDALRALETTELYATAIPSRLDAGRLAGRLWAFWRVIGDGEQAETWLGYLGKLALPAETHDAIQARAELMAERCGSGLVLV